MSGVIRLWKVLRLMRSARDEKLGIRRHGCSSETGGAVIKGRAARVGVVAVAPGAIGGVYLILGHRVVHEERGSSLRLLVPLGQLAGEGILGLYIVLDPSASGGSGQAASSAPAAR